jgi:hypothetical protein
MNRFNTKSGNIQTKHLRDVTEGPLSPWTWRILLTINTHTDTNVTGQTGSSVKEELALGVGAG